VASPSSAPGRLEQVRTFLNTWELPHETRTPADHLPALVADAEAWRAALPDVPRPPRRALTELTELRTVLRESLGLLSPHALRDWLERHPVVATIGDDEPLHHRPSSPGAVPALLALAVEAVAARHWIRLKACPDCRHVFYDHSRNRTRTWCGMYAETPDGRACGSIAKVRNYRNRLRAKDS
jgi:predicted RNA-binding Zn ribbon-like protein